MSNQSLKIGDHTFQKGCFTEEYCIRGLSLEKIGQELGLPQHRLRKGAFIAFAIHLPSYYQFELGGWAEFSTDKFVSYSRRSGKVRWSEEKFEETYEGKRMPISIEEAKDAWLKNMRHHKLVKVLPIIPPKSTDSYPPGKLASQILVTHPLRCRVVKLMKGESGEVFRGVWS